MIIFRLVEQSATSDSGPVSQFCMFPKVEQSATSDSGLVSQVTPPFPSHPVFGAAQI